MVVGWGRAGRGKGDGGRREGLASSAGLGWAGSWLGAGWPWLRAHGPVGVMGRGGDSGVRWDGNWVEKYFEKKKIVKKIEIFF